MEKIEAKMNSRRNKTKTCPRNEKMEVSPASAVITIDIVVIMETVATGLIPEIAY